MKLSPASGQEWEIGDFNEKEKEELIISDQKHETK